MPFSPASPPVTTPVPPCPRRTLVAVTAMIALTETLAMLLLDLARQQGMSPPFWLEITLDAVAMALLSGLVLWFAWIKNLYLGLAQERSQVGREQRLNADLKRALDEHALVTITDTTGRLIFANEKFCRVSGYTQEQLRDGGQIPAEALPRLEDVWPTISQGKVWHGEFQIRRQDGGRYWVDTTIVPFQDERGEPCQYVAIHRDITAQKAQEDELLRLRMAVEASADMILLTDADESIKYANPAFCRFTGWDKADVIGRKPAILKSGRTSPATYDAMWMALSRNESWSGHLLNRRRPGTAVRPSLSASASRILSRRKDDPIVVDGPGGAPDPDLYWAGLTITPICDAAGKRLGYVSIQRDISDKVIQEERLALSRMDAAARLTVMDILDRPQPLKERFESVLEALFALPDLDLQQKGGIFLKRLDGQGLDMFVLSGEFSEAFVHRERCVPLGACLCGRAAASGELLVSEDCFCDPRHEHQYEGATNHGHYIVPLMAGGEALGVMCLYTEPHPHLDAERLAMLKQLGENLGLAVLQERARLALEAARDAALSASRQKSEFLANMSHEIRTPMNGVLGMLELLCRTPLTAQQRECAETAAGSAETLLRIINEILDFSKIEAGKLELDHTDFNLRTLIEETSLLLAGSAHAKGLDFNCFVDSDIPARVAGDPMRLRQVLNNLIGNAIKFTARGEVSVEADSVALDEKHILLRVDVRDTGIGIPDDALARLFRPFEQADGATTRRFGGTGLGLSIAKSIVEAMGGMIKVENQPGGGSAFRLTAKLETRPAQMADQARSLPGRRILIVDDNATNRHILKRFLMDWSAEVEAASHALEAMEILLAAHRDRRPFDLAILDMQMPEIDGLMLGRILSQDERFDRLPRVLLSSGGAVNDKQCADAGIGRTLTKPVRPSYLFDALVSALDEGWGKAPETAPKPAQSLPRFAGRRILLAEDNVVNQKVALKMLEQFEVSVDLVADGQDALAKLERNAYDLAFMDCQMPNLDGYAATRAWRARESALGRSRLPIVALTANALEGEREKCLGAGMDGHLAKPFMLDGLAHMLSRWLPSAAPPVTAPLAASPSANSVWDAATTLERLAGDVELLEELKTSFIDEAAARILELTPALNQPAETIRQIAHLLKGMAGHFFAPEVTAAAIEVERQAKTGAIAPDDPRIARLVEAVERLMRAMREPA
ncbi:response regulator [Methylomagnum sp.]